MPAIAFQANPEKWTEEGTMRAYLENEDKYVYWSTPEDQVSPKRIQIGNRALIVRTKSTGLFGPRAIIAVGTVGETPKKYRPGIENEFLFPGQMKSPGDEHAASSDWKTGIRLAEVRWEHGIPAEKLRDIDDRLARGQQGTAFLITDAQWARIEAMWENS